MYPRGTHSKDEEDQMDKIARNRDIEKIKANGRNMEVRVANVPNLSLRITPAGTKTWSYMFWPEPDRRRKMSLGIWPEIDLQAAKDKAMDVLAQIRKGVDPMAEPVIAQSSRDRTWSSGTVAVITIAGGVFAVRRWLRRAPGP